MIIKRKELARLEGSFPSDYIKDIIDKLQQFNGDRIVLVEDAEYGEFQAIDVKPEDDRFVMITTTVK